jgi:hypothetical protein
MNEDRATVSFTLAPKPCVLKPTGDICEWKRGRPHYFEVGSAMNDNNGVFTIDCGRLQEAYPGNIVPKVGDDGEVEHASDTSDYPFDSDLTCYCHDFGIIRLDKRYIVAVIVSGNGTQIGPVDLVALLIGV